MQPETAHAEQKYRGEIASGYDAKREGTAKREAERRLIEAMLADLPAGTPLLDVPIGTGWLIPYYEKRGFNVLGLDINEDMLAEARKKVATDRIKVRAGNILSTGLVAKSVDVAVAVRLFNWIAAEDVQRALQELQRVARRRVVFNARISDHVRARPMGLLLSAIDLDHWRLTRSDEIEANYLMFMLERA